MKCFICSNTTWENLFSSEDRLYHISGSFQVAACTKCGLWRLEPALREKDIRKYYPKTYYSYKKGAKPGIFWQLRSFSIATSTSSNILHKLLRVFVKIPAIPSFITGGKILDIGCGSGETLRQLKDIGWDVYGVDIDRKAINIAHGLGLLHVKFGTYRDIKDYPDNFFDCIRLYHVIEHLDNPSECLKLAYKKLKAGGEIIIGTPNGGSFIAQTARQYWYNLDSPRHRFIFSKKTLTSILDKLRFRNIKTSYASAGGLVGSIQYFLNTILKTNMDLINRPILILLFYPLEWLVDQIGKGDVFVIRANKS